MQISDVPHTLSGFVYAAIGALAVGIPSLVAWLSNRRKTQADTHLSNALAGKADQERRSGEIRSSIEAAETIMHLIAKVREVERELEVARVEIKRLSGNGKAR